MLNPDQYNALTTSFVGKSLPHCLEENESEEKQKKRYDTFLKQFQYVHKKDCLKNAGLRLYEEKEHVFTITNGTR